MAFPYNKSLFLSAKIHQYLDFKTKDLHILNNIQVFIFPNPTAAQQISSHTHTLHPYIINIDKANTLHHTFHAI